MEEPEEAPDNTPKRRPTRASRNRAISGLMAAQGGMVSHAQLLELGLSAKAIKKRVDSGELVRRTEHQARRSSKAGRASKTDRPTPIERRLTTSVYGAHDGVMQLDALRWRGQLSGPKGSRVGGVSSCAILDLEPQRGTLIHVVHPGSGWDPPRGVEARRTDHLPDEDCAETDGLPHCAPARSLMDAARSVDQERLDDMIDRSIVLRIHDELEMRRVIRERRTLPEASRLEEAIDRLDERSGEYRSAFERRAVRLLGQSKRLPAPVVNTVADGYGHRPDIYYLGTSAIIELDGDGSHTSPAQRIADLHREEILRSLGYVFLRLRWNQVVYEPDRTLARVEDFVLRHSTPPIPRG